MGSGTVRTLGVLRALGALRPLGPLHPLGALDPDAAIVAPARVGDALAAPSAAIIVLRQASVGAELEAHAVACGIHAAYAHAAYAHAVEAERRELLRERGAPRRGQVAEIDVLDARAQAGA